MKDADDERSTVSDEHDMPEAAERLSWRDRLARLRMRRRTAITVTIAVLAVLALLVLPAYLSSRPSFFGRYEGLAGQYDSWAESTHAEVSCEDCHVPPNTFARTGYRMLMISQVYLSAVGAPPPDVFDTPANAACLECHNDLRTVSPEGDLQIPHRAHVNILQMDCVECHSYLVHELSPSGGHVPEMETCLKCHDGDRAKNACSSCHTEKAAPATHSTKDWLVVHPDQPDRAACAKCHDWAGDWCVQCHETRPRSHGSDWRAAHGAAVKAHRNCEACHEGTFCVDCHGAVPQLNLDPALKLVE